MRGTRAGKGGAVADLSINASRLEPFIVIEEFRNRLHVFALALSLQNFLIIILHNYYRKVFIIDK